MAKIKIICPECQKSFVDYKSNRRKFCSRECYISFWHRTVASKISEMRSVKKTRHVCPECAKVFQDVPSNKRKYCSKKCSNKHTLFTADKVRGEKNTNWNNGSSLQQHRPKKWRLSVLEKDGHICQSCGATGVYLQADHIDPWYLSKKKRFDINNGQALCVPCHKFKTRVDMFLYRKPEVRYKVQDTWYLYL